MQEEKIDVEDLLGYKHLSSGFRIEDNKMIGTYKTVWYDRQGNIKEIKKGDTGIIGEFK